MKIVTHNAKFHADDVFAIASLLILYPDAEVIRTRDEAIIKSADIAVDVGDIYDDTTNRFDHHQYGGAGERKNGIPYASLGLVWKKFGEEISGSKELAERIDGLIVQPIDATDNGKDIIKTLVEGVYPAGLYEVVDSYRATWKEEGDWDKRFMQCVEWAKSFLIRKIKIERDELEAIEIVQKAYAESADKRLVVIDDKYDLGREVVTSVLTQFEEPVYAVLYRHDHQNWQLVAIRKESGSFDLRKPVPLEWHAKHNNDLDIASGVNDCVFCHRKGFMCVTKSKESILKLAEIALSA